VKPFAELRENQANILGNLKTFLVGTVVEVLAQGFMEKRQRILTVDQKNFR
jgi:hypothetical protein